MIQKSSNNEIQDILVNLNSILRRNLKFINLNYSKSKSEMFYGHSFLLGFKNHIDSPLYNLILDETISEIEKKDKSVHLEFLKTAVGLNSLKKSNQNKELSMLNQSALKAGYRNNSTTNWVLLKLLAQILLKENYCFTELTSKLLLYFRKSSSNFFRDNWSDFSLQYYWFIIWELAKIYQFTQKKYYLKQYLKSIELGERLILGNARISYFGRGQEQLFSYGACIFAFCFKYFLFREVKSLDFLNKITSFLLSIQDKSGYIPLVLSRNRTYNNFGVIDNPTNLSKFKKGWYRYNNFWDYFSFLTYSIYDSINLLNNIKTRNPIKLKSNQKTNASIPNFIWKFDFNEDLSVFYLKLGRKLSQDLFFPYIVYKNRFFIPIPGGEEFKNPLDIHFQASYPYLKIKDKTISLIKRDGWVFNKNVGKISTRFFDFRRMIDIQIKNAHILDIKIIDDIKLNRIIPNMEFYSSNIPLWSKPKNGCVILTDEKCRISINFPLGFKISKNKIFTPLGEAFRLYVKEEKLKREIKKTWKIKIETCK